MKTLLNAILILLLMICVPACKRNHYRVNASKIDVDIKMRRLEKDLFNLNPDKIISSLPGLKSEYGSFLQLFSYVINTGDIDDPSFGEGLVSFCTDKLNNEVYAATMKIFPDVSPMEKELDDAFRHYLYYFPGRNLPSVYTCITGFNNSIITGDSVLAISLDRYLGADSKYYPRLGIYSYISARMTPEYTVPDMMYGWIASEWDFSSMGYQNDDVLTHIIHDGKLRYLEKCLLPGEKDEIIFGFTSDQLKFCRNNEDQMWVYLAEKNLLFSTDQLTIRKLTGEAPFTSYFTPESPGKAAVWTGFRIVESYMVKNPGVSMTDLMNDKDVQGILEKSKYNPQ